MRTILSGIAKGVLAFMLVFSLFAAQPVYADASAPGAGGKLIRLETILKPIIEAAKESGIEAAVAIKDLSGSYGAGGDRQRKA